MSQDENNLQSDGTMEGIEVPLESQTQEPPQEMEEEIDELGMSKNERFMASVARTMPWVISLLFHVGIFLVMIFFMFVVAKTKTVDALIVPDAILSDDPGAPMTPMQQSQSTKSQAQTARKEFEHKQAEADTGQTKQQIIALAGGTTSGGAKGMKSAASGGPRSRFYGSGGNAFNIVYVIDRSGSMLDTFDLVRREMLRSIGQLKNTQMFHVILFAAGRPMEATERRLVPATPENKYAVASWLRDVVAERDTNPVPALERAFSVLQNAKKPGKLIYLLTDGRFDDSEAVLRAIEAKNREKKVHINTFLYGTQPPDAVEVMTKIASENGGRYTSVKHQN